MPVIPKPIDQVAYLLVRCETDQDIETIVGHIEHLEHNISPLTSLEIVDYITTTKWRDSECGAPEIKQHR